MKKLLAALIATTCMTSAHAEGITEFNIGILGGENAQDRITSNECYRAAIEKEIGVPVKVFTPADYDGVIQGLLGGTLDVAFLGASAYAKITLTDAAAVEAPLTAMNVDGTTGYYSIGFTRKDTGITSIEEAKGKIFAFGEPNSTSGFLVPASELTAMHGDLKAFFKDVPFSGGHEQTIVGVANGTYDAGVSFGDGIGDWAEGYTSGGFHKAAEAGLVDMNTLVEIWRSKLIPNGPFVIRAALPQDVKDKVVKLTDTLAEVDHACAMSVNGGDLKDYVPVEAGFYDGIVEARKFQDAQK
ncbi:phosphonate ABC transporter substrate-binding protein [Rhodobacter sp. KR11]|uniref:phosphonate ABC transporter substrate-binding protein n=1 Tax=Rhodobacter sp. KR11 TaxID=2974588 RepID=UPI0022221D06|nr:phosphonate ABC transporter substrate-binding protein [Rhodobacter sp. KR11]MCW1920346.1 phosphonate ABC transporter substrate-binding protein [Rhodobacter sp. KR11]